MTNDLENFIKKCQVQDLHNWLKDNNNFTPYEENIYFLLKESNFQNSKGKKIFDPPLQVGEIELDNASNMEFFLIRSSEPITERTSKKNQFEIGKDILKKKNADAGLFIFYYDDKAKNQKNYRFSLIFASYFGTKRTFSTYKRFTYLVSSDKQNTTFFKYVGNCKFSSLDEIKEAFSVEPITKQFYAEIQNWYFWAINEIKFPEDYKYSVDHIKDKELPNAKILIRLITRIIFIWFLKEKKLVPSKLFSEEDLQSIVRNFMKDKKASNYYNAILQNLFFATLNHEMNNRRFADERGYPYDIKDYGIKNLYRYEDKFLIPKDDVLKLFKEIPFLNGGLFDCLDKEDEPGKVDGFSRNPAKQAVIPDVLFFQEEGEKIDLSKFGLGKDKPVRGLINILHSYDFTIDENSPIDQDIALDPELLGKVFENLLAAYNPETATTARKSTGSYYTPREIVDYMVTESLVMHLASTLGDEPATIEKLKKLFSYSDDGNPFDAEETESIISSIEKIRVLDPACGSGAFPMGILHKLVLALHKLDPQNTKWKKRLIEGVPPELQAEIDNSLKNKSLDYIRKLGIIEHCIFGVDTQEIAIQISKLRFFISLLIEQDVDDSKDNRDIRALPNLETKFVAANTLIGLDMEGGDNSKLKTQMDTRIKVKTPEVENLESKIKDINSKIFYVSNHSAKLKLQEKDKELKKLLRDALENAGLLKSTADQIAEFDPFDQNATADWFDPEWMFGVTDGFDIVIGNPPYIQLQKNSGKLGKLYQEQGYDSFASTGDIYTLFYERGIQIAKDNGILCYITSNKWMRAGYGEKLRRFFIKYNPKILIDLGPNVFENATVDTNILLIQKSQNEKNLKALTINEKKKDDINIAQLLNNNSVILKNLSEDAWFIGNDDEQKLKEKIERIGKPLKDWDVNIYRGVLTGLNEAFIIDSAKRQEILDNCKDDDERRRTEAIIKPILRGRDIKRYSYEWAGLWVIFIPWHFPLHNDTTIQGASNKAELEFQRQYPTIYNHLLEFKEKLIKRNREETGIRYEWYALQRCAATYYPEFEKEKVVWTPVNSEYSFTIIPEGIYFVNSVFMCTGPTIKLFCSVFNSKLIRYYLTFLFSNEEVYTYASKENITKLPIPPITSSNQPIVSLIELLVDKILAAKKDNPHSDTTEWEKEIDQLVYQLYELTEEEIKLIEGGNNEK